MSRYTHSKGYASYQDAMDSIETMVKNGDINPKQVPKVVPYRFDKHVYKFAIDLLRV